MPETTTPVDIPQEITSVVEVANSSMLTAVEEVHEYPPLTTDEETFALAIVECEGNIAAAYRTVYGQEVAFPLARGKALLCKPAIALKIRDLTEKIEDASLISTGAHLNMLAMIRDQAMVTGQIKVAYQAERSRGEAVGIYQKHEAKNKSGGTGNVQINVVMASKFDSSI